MNEIKINDFVKITRYTTVNGLGEKNEYPSHESIGAIVKIIEINHSWEYPYYSSDGCRRKKEDIRLLYNCELEKLKKNNKLNNKFNNKHMNNITTLIKKITRQEPEKTFEKVGFIDEYDNITEEGRDVLLYVLWEEKKEELKKLADAIIKVTQKDKN